MGLSSSGQNCTPKDEPKEEQVISVVPAKGNSSEWSHNALVSRRRAPLCQRRRGGPVKKRRGGPKEQVHSPSYKAISVGMPAWMPAATTLSQQDWRQSRRPYPMTHSSRKTNDGETRDKRHIGRSVTRRRLEFCRQSCRV